MSWKLTKLEKPEIIITIFILTTITIYFLIIYYKMTKTIKTFINPSKNKLHKELQNASKLQEIKTRIELNNKIRYKIIKQQKSLQLDFGYVKRLYLEFYFENEFSLFDLMLDVYEFSVGKYSVDRIFYNELKIAFDGIKNLCWVVFYEKNIKKRGIDYFDALRILIDKSKEAIEAVFTKVDSDRLESKEFDEIRNGFESLSVEFRDVHAWILNQKISNSQIFYMNFKILSDFEYNFWEYFKLMDRYNEV